MGRTKRVSGLWLRPPGCRSSPITSTQEHDAGAHRPSIPKKDLSGARSGEGGLADSLLGAQVNG